VVQSFKTPVTADLEDWLERTGYCVAGRTWRNVMTLKGLEAMRARFAGIGGEIGRGYYYRETDRTDTHFSPKEVVERLHLPVTSELCSAARDWLGDTPRLNAFHLLDLLYIEQRIGCWASVTPLGHADSAYTIFPFNDRRVVQALLSLSREQKKSESWMEDVIEATWPELLEFPFDQYVGWPRLANAMQSRLRPAYLRSLPSRLYRKLRNSVGFQN
jgi:hypothetical protein